MKKEIDDFKAINIFVMILNAINLIVIILNIIIFKNDFIRWFTWGTLAVLFLISLYMFIINDINIRILKKNISYMEEQMIKEIEESLKKSEEYDIKIKKVRKKKEPKDE